MSQEKGQKRVHAFADKDGFDRVARAARYVERLMKGVTEPTPHQYHPQPDGTVRVQTINPNPSGGSTPPFPIPSGDGLYPGRFVYYDVELQDYRPLGEVKEETHLCLMFGMNQEALEFPSAADDFDGKYYRGRVVGYYIDVAEGELQTDVAYEQWKGVPVVEVTVGGGNASVWNHGRVVSRLGNGPQASYTVQPIKLGSGTTYVNDGDQVTPCYRADTKDRDEPILIDIPEGNGCMWRPSKDDPNKFELAPWGGLKRSIIEHVYRVCGLCVNVAGVFKIRIKTASRMLAEDARDRRVLHLEATEGEANIEDNTDLQIDPNPSTGI